MKSNEYNPINEVQARMQVKNIQGVISRPRVRSLFMGILSEKTKYYPGIKRYIASRIRNPDDAEDLTQSVFLEFYRGNYNGDNLESYLFGIARKLIASYYRQKDKEPEILCLNAKIADEAAFEDYNSNSRAKYFTEEINKVIFQLPPKASEAVELRLIVGLSYSEAARKANCSIKIFYARFYQGLKILKKHFASNQLKKKDLRKKT